MFKKLIINILDLILALNFLICGITIAGSLTTSLGICPVGLVYAIYKKDIYLTVLLGYLTIGQFVTLTYIILMEKKQRREGKEYLTYEKDDSMVVELIQEIRKILKKKARIKKS